MEFKEHDLMTYLLDRLPKKAQKGFMSTNVEWTCLDANKDLIVLGANISLAYVYDRKVNNLTKLKLEDKNCSVSCVKLQSSLDHQVAVGTNVGHVELFLLPSRAPGHGKEVKKFTLKGLHRTSVTCAEWSTNGMKLFTGDGLGNVLYTEVDFYENVKSSSIIIRESDPIVQLSYAHRALLVSTLSRTFICYTSENNKIQQVGQKPRKVNGNFGAHFIPAMCKPSNATMYVARPGLHLWKASMDGSVLETLKFKDSFSRDAPTIQLLPETKVPLLGEETEPQFGRIQILNESILAIWSYSTLFIVNPKGESGASVLASSHGYLGSIINIAVTEDEIFVLRRGTARPLVRLGSCADQKPVKETNRVEEQEMGFLQNLKLPGPAPIPTNSSIKKKSDIFMEGLTSMKNVFKKAADEIADGAVKAKEDIERNAMSLKLILDKKSDDCISDHSGQSDQGFRDGQISDGEVEMGVTALPTPKTPEAVPSGQLLSAGFKYDVITDSSLKQEGIIDVEGLSTKVADLTVPDNTPVEESEKGLAAAGVAERDLDLQMLNLMGQQKFDDIVFLPKPKKKKKKKASKDISVQSQENGSVLSSDMSFVSTISQSYASQFSREISSEHTNGYFEAEEVNKEDAIEEITKDIETSSEQVMLEDMLTNSVNVNFTSHSNMNDNQVIQSGNLQPASDVNNSEYLQGTSESFINTPEFLAGASAFSQLQRMGVQFEKMRPSDQPLPLKSYEATPNLGFSQTDGFSDQIDSELENPESDVFLQQPEQEEIQNTKVRAMSSFEEDIYTKYRNSSGSFEVLEEDRVQAHPLAPPEDSDSDSETESHEYDDSSEPGLDGLDDLALFENVQQKLAGSWMQCTSPGYVMQLIASEKHLWCVDYKDRVFFSLSTKVTCSWNKLKGVYAKQIAVSPSGNIVWRVHRKSNIAYASAPILSRSKIGAHWNQACKDVSFVCLDETMAWIIKTNGEVCIQKGIKREKPITITQPVESNYQVTEIVANRGVVWARTLENKVVYRTDVNVNKPYGKRWSEFDDENDVRAVSISLDNKGMGWAIDKDGRLWFRNGLCLEHPQGDDKRWWQVTMSEYMMEDPNVLKIMVNMAGSATKVDRVVSWLKKQAYQATQVAANSCGVWVCGAYQFKTTLQVSRGNLLGSCWEMASPAGLPSTSNWISLSAQAVYGPSGLVWAVQKSGEIFCFPPTTRKTLSVTPPERIRFSLLSATTEVLWALSENGTVYLRVGITGHCPQGTQWRLLDVTQQLGSNKIVHLSCGSEVVWAVDSSGSCHLRVGVDLPRNEGLPRAWLPVDGKPTGYNTFFTQVYCGSSDSMVWAVDNKKAVYARKGVTQDLPVGKEWELVEGTQASELCISSDTVWALCPNGDIACRYGTSDKSPRGDYWKKVPGNFIHLSATQNNDLWAIRSDGTLYQRFVKVFKRQEVDSPLTAYQVAAVDDEEWELL